MGETLITQFKLVRSTKRTHVFEEVPGPGVAPIIGTLYVQQFAIPADTKTLRVTVTPEK